MARRLRDAPLFALLVLAGCSKGVPGPPSGAVARSAAATSSTAPLAPTSESSASAVAAEAPEASWFSLRCPGATACLLRGTVRAIRETPDAPTQSSESILPPSPPVRTLELAMEPDDSPPCETPLDASSARRKPLAPVTRALIVGGARLAGRLAGAHVCGWSSTARQAGLGYPSGTEGELFDATGKLLAAWSFAFERDQTPELARSWRFSREGRASRRPAEDDEGFFVLHERVRVIHGGASAVSVAGGEAVLRARDGTFAVSATSDLTEGPVRVYVGHHDSFGFSAVRLTD